MLWLGVELTPKSDREIIMEALVGEQQALGEWLCLSSVIQKSKRYRGRFLGRGDSSEFMMLAGDILSGAIQLPCLPLRDSKVERALRSDMPVAEMMCIEIERFLKGHFPNKSDEDIEVKKFQFASEEIELDEDTVSNYVGRGPNAESRLTLPFDLIPPL